MMLYSILLVKHYFQGSYEYINIASRWVDGLLNKDVEITNEVYAVQGVDFDRQVSGVFPLQF